MLSATNDVAIDGYTIEFLDKGELGLANGIRIGLYRVGMLASGFILMASDWLAGTAHSWSPRSCSSVSQSRRSSRPASG